jgi:putative flippase GtrA
MENSSLTLTKKDYFFGSLAGALIGLLILPILKTAQPSVFEKYALLVFFFFLIATPLGVITANLIGRKIAAIWQIAKFGVIGVINTLVDLGLLAVITFTFKQYLAIDSNDLVMTSIVLTFYSLFKASSFIVANVNSYFWNKYWTFEANASQKKPAEFIQFFVVSLVGLAVNVLVASLFVKSAPFGSINSDQIGLLGGAAGSVSGLAWNFIGYKFIVFKKR